MDLSKYGYLLPTPDDATRWGQRRKVEERWVLPRWREVEVLVDLQGGGPLLLPRDLHASFLFLQEVHEVAIVNWLKENAPSVGLGGGGITENL